MSENYCAGIGVRGDTPTYFKEITLEKAEDPSVTDPDPDPEPEPEPEPEPPVEPGDSSVCAGALTLVFAAAAAGTVLRRRRRAATEE